VALAAVAFLVTRPIYRPKTKIKELEFGQRPPLAPILRFGEERLREAALSTFWLQELDDPEMIREMRDLLNRLLEPLSDDLQVDLVVLDSMVVNAFAFPGDLIVVNAGLIRAMDGPEELAAVMAHELGHLIHRDAIKAVSRQIGLALLLSLIGGGDVEVLVQRVLGQVIGQKFSRDVEARADQFALELLRRSGLNPTALGDALSRLGGDSQSSGLMKYLDSHPDIESRVQKAYQAGADWEGSPRALSEVDWTVIREAL
jgi:predicted Zn-dependent protease